MKGVFGIVLISMLLVNLFSCKKDKSPDPDFGYNYFPDQVGRYVVYNVDSFYYDDFRVPLKIDSFKFQIKEKIESIFPDNQNRPTIRLERYIKHYSSSTPYSAMSWQLRDVWAENKTVTSAEKVEENVRYIKLSFPVKQYQKWNGNAQNTVGPEDYQYGFFDVPRTMSGMHFDSVLQVNQYDVQSLIQRKLYTEKYARNVGLIYKQEIDVVSQPNPAWNDSTTQAFFNNPILQRVTSGFQYTMTVSEYGIE